MVDTSVGAALGFMEAHVNCGDVTTQPYANAITVAASAIEGEGRVAVHGRTPRGQRIGGLMDVKTAEALVATLQRAIGHANHAAVQQRTRADTAGLEGTER